MKLPESWTTVTLLSKTLAIILFVSLPFIGFYFGYQYHKNIFLPEDSIQTNTIVQQVNQASVTPPNLTLTLTSTPTVGLSVKPTVVESDMSLVVIKYQLPSGWTMTNTIEGFYSIGYQDIFRPSCPEYQNRNCKLILKSNETYNIFLFTDNYDGGSRRADLENRWGKKHDAFVEYQFGQYKGVGTIFRNPMEIGGNQFILAVPVGSKVLYLTTNILNTYNQQNSGLDINYILKEFLPTLKIN